jgi:hypothetical protein
VGIKVAPARDWNEDREEKKNDSKTMLFRLLTDFFIFQ